MATDKRKRRKRLQRLPDHIQHLIAFGAFAASMEIPPEERDRKMGTALQWVIDLLHREGYVAPIFLLKPYWYFRPGMTNPNVPHGPNPRGMLMMAERLVEDLPADERYAAMQDLLAFFQLLYRMGEAEMPEWLRMGLREYGMGE